MPESIPKNNVPDDFHGFADQNITIESIQEPSVNFQQQSTSLSSNNNTGTSFSQETSALPKKPTENFLTILAAAVIVGIVSVLLSIVSGRLWGFLIESFFRPQEMDGLLYLGLGLMLISGIFYGSIVTFSLIASKFLIKKNKVSMNFAKTFVIILVASLLVGLTIDWTASTIYNKVTQPGNEKPVQSWNKYNNADFSFSYPKDTNLNQGKAPDGLSVNQTSEQYQKVNREPLQENQASVDLFNISVVNPEYYKNDPGNTSSAAKAYADKIYQLNKFDQNNQTDVSSYSNVDGQVVTTKVGNQTAYGMTIVYLFKNPGGKMQLRQANGYSHGSLDVYYLDFKGKVYQISLATQNEIGRSILNTLKFSGDASVDTETATPLLSVEGTINLFTLYEETSYKGEKETGDPYLANGPSGSLVRLSNENPSKPKVDDGTGNFVDTADYRITDDTTFIIDGKEVSRLEIKKIDLSKSSMGGGVEAKYRRADVKYNKFPFDSEGYYYYVAKSITFYQN